MACNDLIMLGDSCSGLLSENTTGVKFFELLDTPNRTEGLNGVGKYLKVVNNAGNPELELTTINTLPDGNSTKEILMWDNSQLRWEVGSIGQGLGFFFSGDSLGNFIEFAGGTVNIDNLDVTTSFSTLFYAPYFRVTTEEFGGGAGYNGIELKLEGPDTVGNSNFFIVDIKGNLGTTGQGLVSDGNGHVVWGAAGGGVTEFLELDDVNTNDAVPTDGILVYYRDQDDSMEFSVPPLDNESPIWNQGTSQWEMQEMQAKLPDGTLLLPHLYWNTSSSEWDIFRMSTVDLADINQTAIGNNKILVWKSGPEEFQFEPLPTGNTYTAGQGIDVSGGNVISIDGGTVDVLSAGISLRMTPGGLPIELMNANSLAACTTSIEIGTLADKLKIRTNDAYGLTNEYLSSDGADGVVWNKLTNEFSYTFTSGLTEIEDLFIGANSVTSVTKTVGINTVEISINGGAFAPLTPVFLIPASANTIVRITYNMGYNSGVVAIKSIAL